MLFRSISFKNKTATVPGTTTKVTLADADGSNLGADDDGVLNVPTQLYKVTYPGGEMLVNEDGKVVDNVTVGVPALVEKSVVFTDNDVIAVNTVPKKPGTSDEELVPIANPKAAEDGASACLDTEYVAAVRMMAGVSVGTSGLITAEEGTIQDATASTGLKLLVATIVDPDTGVKVGLAAADYVQAGTTVYFSAGSELTTPVAGKYPHAGKGVALTVNGEKLNFTVGSDGAISGDQMTYELPAAYAAGKSAIEFTVSLSVPTNDVMVDGVTVDRKDMGNDDPTDDVLVIPNMKGYSLVYKDTDDETWKEISGGVLDVDGKMTLGVNALDGRKIPVEDEALQLKRGYKVVTGNAGTFTVQTMDEDGKTLTNLAAAAFYPADTTEKVYIKGEANVILAKANTTELPGKTYSILNNTASAPAVWEVPVTGNITKDDYVALITVDPAAAPNDAISGAVIADEKIEITVAATGDYIKLGQVVGISGKFVPAEGSELKSSDVKVTVEVSKAKVITITVVSSKGVDQAESDGEDKELGNIVLTFEGYDLSLEDIVLTVPKKEAQGGGH